MVVKSQAFELFEQLQRPANGTAISVKFDTSSIDSFLEKLLLAVKATNDEVVVLREDNKKLSDEVAALRQQVKSSDVGDLGTVTEELKARVQTLEDQLKTAEEKLSTKAEEADLGPLQTKADAAADAASRIQTDFTTFHIEHSKWSKSVDSRLSGLQSSLADQVNMLSEQKANRNDVDDVKSRVDTVAQTNAKIDAEMAALKASVVDFSASIDGKIINKADVGMLDDKMGRMETDDLLNQLSNQLSEKHRKVGKELQELREDLDVILTMIMQDANVGAGMLKCMSCERPVAMPRPVCVCACVCARDMHMYIDLHALTYMFCPTSTCLCPGWNASSWPPARQRARAHHDPGNRPPVLSRGKGWQLFSALAVQLSDCQGKRWRGRAGDSRRPARAHG